MTLIDDLKEKLSHPHIGVIGAGAWGTALATVAAHNHPHVTLWAREEEVVSSINNQHENTLFLPDVVLSKAIHATSELKDLAKCDMLLSVTPAQFLRQTLKSLAAIIKPKIPVIICSKGIEIESLTLMHDVAQELLPDHPILVLSGPSFAKEVAEQAVTHVNIAASNQEHEAMQRVRDTLTTPYFHLHPLSDMVAAEVAGATKNVLAIAAGIAQGAKFSENTKAALMVEGLREMRLLISIKGGDPAALDSLAGIGDILLTCSSTMSRNMSLGIAIGEGKTVKQVLDSRHSVAEGVATSHALHRLMEKENLPLPLFSAVYHILFEEGDIARLTEALV